MSTYVYIPRRCFEAVKAGMKYAANVSRHECRNVYLSMSGCCVDLYFSDSMHVTRLSTINKTPVSRSLTLSFDLDVLSRILKIEKLFELSMLVGDGKLDGIIVTGRKSNNIPAGSLGIALIDFVLDEVPSAMKRFADNPASRVWLTEPVKIAPEYMSIIGSMYSKLGASEIACVHCEKISATGNYETTFEGFDRFGWQIRTTIIAKPVEG